MCGGGGGGGAVHTKMTCVALGIWALTRSFGANAVLPGVGDGDVPQSRALFDAKKADMETVARKKAEEEVKQLRHEVRWT